MSTLRIYSLAAAFTGRFISAAGVFILSALLTQKLSLQQSGQFFTAFIALMGAAIVLQAGLNVLLIRKIASQKTSPEAQPSIFARFFYTVLASSAIGAVLALAFALTFNWMEVAFGWLWLPLVPTSLIGVIGSQFKALEKPGWGGFWETGVISTITCIAILFLQPETALEAWLIFSGISWISCALAITQLIFREPAALKYSPPSFELILEARALGFSALLSYLAQWGGVLLAAALLGTESTTILNALFRILAPIQFVILTLDYYLAPKFATAPPKTQTRLYRTGTLTAISLSAPYALALLATPDFSMRLLFGPALQEQFLNMALLLVGATIQTGLGPNGILLNMTGREQANLNALLLSTLVYTIGATVLAPHFGVTAFILMYTLSTLMKAIFLKIAAKPLLRINS